MADVIQQLRTEKTRDSQRQNRHIEQHEHSAAESISKAHFFPSHTESATSFQEAGKAATTRDNFAMPLTMMEIDATDNGRGQGKSKGKGKDASGEKGNGKGTPKEKGKRK